MKKLLLVVMLAIGCIACHSQECPYKFMGIPIEGDIEVFAKKLEEKGFKINEVFKTKLGNELFLEGEFFGKKRGVFLSTEDPQSNIIASVSVNLAAGLDHELCDNILKGLQKQYSDTTMWNHKMEDGNITRPPRYVVQAKNDKLPAIILELVPSMNLLYMNPKQRIKAENDMKERQNQEANKRLIQENEEFIKNIQDL